MRVNRRQERNWRLLGHPDRQPPFAADGDVVEVVEAENGGAAKNL